MFRVIYPEKNIFQYIKNKSVRFSDEGKHLQIKAWNIFEIFNKISTIFSTNFIEKIPKFAECSLFQIFRSQKKIFLRKMSVRSNPIFQANLATSEENWIFGRPKRPFWMPIMPKRDMMWYEIFRTSLFLE